MLSGGEADRLAGDWIENFSVDPYVVRQREMDAWFKLDDLVHNHPQDALLAFEKVAQKEMINWTFEGISVGPLRSFLMIYGDRFNIELGAIARRNRAFEEMHTMAVEGM